MQTPCVSICTLSSEEAFLTGRSLSLHARHNACTHTRLMALEHKQRLQRTVPSDGDMFLLKLTAINWNFNIILI